MLIVGGQGRWGGGGVAEFNSHECPFEDGDVCRYSQCTFIIDSVTTIRDLYILDTIIVNSHAHNNEAGPLLT